jgi:hypothetical protein
MVRLRLALRGLLDDRYSALIFPLLPPPGFAAARELVVEKLLAVIAGA